MSAEVVVNKDGKKPQYKDYVSFLQQYKNKDENSATANGTLKKGFKEYLEDYNNKKYSPVQPPIAQKSKEEKKIVKTEMFVEINNAPCVRAPLSKDIQSQSNGSVKFTNLSDITYVNGPVKFFNPVETTNECNGPVKFVDRHEAKIEDKVSVFEIHQTDSQERKKLSIGEISRKFEDNKANSTSTNEVFKPPLKKKTSISNMTKVFEDNCNVASQNDKKHIEVRKNIFNNAAQISKTQTAPSTGIAIVPSQITIVPASPILARQPPKPSPPPSQTPPQIKVIPPSKSSSPAPPDNSAPPPPPPMPPASFSAKRSTSAHVKVNQPVTKANHPVQKSQTNGYNTLPKMHAVSVDTTDNGKTVPKIDRNDPMMKKLVYNALREMVVGYHDQANDYLATLPKNRVKKNTGLDSIISSLGSQGGLDKLTGRGKMSTIENE